jgi:hypothetical protein
MRTTDRCTCMCVPLLLFHRESSFAANVCRPVNCFLACSPFSLLRCPWPVLIPRPTGEPNSTTKHHTTQHACKTRNKTCMGLEWGATRGGGAGRREKPDSRREPLRPVEWPLVLRNPLVDSLGRPSLLCVLCVSVVVARVLPLFEFPLFPASVAGSSSFFPTPCLSVDCRLIPSTPI